MSESITSQLLALCSERFDDGHRLRAEDDFFDVLGIDSMEAMDLLGEIEDHFDIEVPDYEMQDVRTIAALTEVVQRRTP